MTGHKYSAPISRDVLRNTDQRQSTPTRGEDDTDACAAPRDDAARLLTAADLARRWQVPKAHVYRLTRERDLPAVRLGRYYRYRLASIETWEDAQEGRAES